MTHTELIIIIAAITLWFAQGWYLNEALKSVHRKLDVLDDQFGGLRRYLYEIDPQFDDERKLLKEFGEDTSMFAGKDHLDLTKQKEAEGRRTLNTLFTD
jgi:hypothetical protein